jgi:hypothetical protein
VCNDTEGIQYDVRQFGIPPSPGSHPINSERPQSGFKKYLPELKNRTL